MPRARFHWLKSKEEFLQWDVPVIVKVLTYSAAANLDARGCLGDLPGVVRMATALVCENGWTRFKCGKLGWSKLSVFIVISQNLCVYAIDQIIVHGIFGGFTVYNVRNERIQYTPELC